MNYWDKLFKDGTIWGTEPSNSAYWTADFFRKNGVSSVLIPGIGYGRNIFPFLNHDMQVTGIEISKKAIETANSLYNNINIHHGSVLNMPFDEITYEGNYCYSLIHLFNKSQRNKILKSFYNQLAPGGLMVNVVISTETHNYGEGKKVSYNRYLLDNGISVFYYDSPSIENEFKEFGLIDFQSYEEPIKFMVGQEPLTCYRIICRKPN